MIPHEPQKKTRPDTFLRNDVFSKYIQIPTDLITFSLRSATSSVVGTNSIAVYTFACFCVAQLAVGQINANDLNYSSNPPFLLSLSPTKRPGSVGHVHGWNGGWRKHWTSQAVKETLVISQPGRKLQPLRIYMWKYVYMYCWWFRNPAHQLRLAVYPIIDKVFIHHRWCWISSINSMDTQQNHSNLKVLPFDTPQHRFWYIELAWYAFTRLVASCDPVGIWHLELHISFAENIPDEWSV